LKILLYSKLFPNHEFPHFATFVRERARQLQKHTRAQITVVAPVPYFPLYRKGSDWEKYTRIPSLESDGEFEIYHPRFPVVRGASLWLQGLSMYLAALSTCKALHKKRGFEWVDGHFVYPDGMAAVLTARKLRVPASVTARGSDINLFSTYNHIRPMIRYTLERADLLVAVSNDLALKMKDLGAEPQRVHVVPNGVDRGLFLPASRDECRRRLGCNRTVSLILCVGNLLPVKNHSILLSCLARLLEDPQSGSGIEVHIIGEGPLLQRLRAQVMRNDLSKRVFFHGCVPQDTLVQWYNASNVLCLPSLREGNPNVVLEALACGIPAVASRVNSLPEIIREGVNGFLFNPVDSAELAVVLRKALSQRWNRQIISESSTNSWETTARTLGRLFEQFSQIKNTRRLPALANIH
jgi:glycosyltransferase involved in cell wall biosynthesis